MQDKYKQIPLFEDAQHQPRPKTKKVKPLMTLVDSLTLTQSVEQQARDLEYLTRVWLAERTMQEVQSDGR